MTEDLRLKALYRYEVLDTLEDQAFDDITRIASAICNTPIALISLVDEKRQWFKSHLGLNASETHRDLAFCSRAILGEGIFEVTDASRDPRFSENPLVTGEFGIRFYAGAPLITSDGYALGTVCVLDKVAKSLSSEQKALLESLSRQVVKLLELRLNEKVRKEKDRLLLRQHELLETSSSIATAANSNGSPRQIYRFTLEKIVNLIQAAAGYYIPVAPDLPESLLKPVWNGENELIPNIGTSKIHQSWIGNKTPTLVSIDSLQDTFISRSEIALLAQAQVKSVLGVPILMGTQTKGTLAFFLKENTELPSELIEMMAQVGIHIGRVSERAKANERHEFIEALLENINLGVVACDAHLQLTLFNPMSRKFHGIDDASGSPESRADKYSLFQKDGKTPLQTSDIPLFRAFQEGSVRDIEMVIAPNGLAPRHVVANGKAFYDAQGVKLGAVVAMHDVTPLHGATEKLRKSEAQLSLAIESSNLGIWDCDLVTRIFTGSESCLRLFEFSTAADHWTMDDFMSKIIPEDQNRVQGNIQRALAGLGQYDVDFKIKSSDGNAKWINSKGKVYFDEVNQPVRWLGTVVDITARKKSEAEFAKTTQRLQAIIEYAALPILSLDRFGLVQIWNPAAEGVMGWTAAEVLGKPVPFASDDPVDNTAKTIQKVLSGDKIINHQVSRRKRDGTLIKLSFSATPLFDTLGAVDGMMVVLMDVTDQVRLQEGLREARLLAEKAAESKSRFLANMSHEIQTPINGIMGMTDLLLDTPINAEQKDYAESVRISAECLLSIVNDILDFSKVEAGKLNLESLDFDPKLMVTETIRSLESNAKKKGINVTHSWMGSSNLGLFGDSGRIRQVLTNLVGNAIKFSAAGEVKVACDLSHGSDGTLRLKIEVIDYGIGMGPETIGRLFQPFMQESSSTSRQYGGTGLGLSISKKLIELMEGKIGVFSEKGKGSNFWFELELPPGIAAHSEKNVSDYCPAPFKLFGEKYHVLVAEDNQVNQVITVKQLEKLGYKTTVVENGEQALKELETGLFDLVLMDCQMPTMDGYEATRLLRLMKKPGVWSGIPVIAMTANALLGDREKCLQAGMDDYISKPVKIKELSQIILKQITIGNIRPVSSA